MSEKIHPGRGWYVVALLVLFAGAGTLVWGIVSMAGMPVPTEIVLPGEGEFTADKPGEFTVYHETHAVVNGKEYSNASFPEGLEFRIRYKPTGQTVPIRTPSVHSNYNVNDQIGESMAVFTAEKPGMYVISGQYPGSRTVADSPRPQAVIAVAADWWMGKALVKIFAGVGAFGVGFIAAAVIFIVTLVRRSSARKKLEVASSPLFTPAAPPPVPPIQGPQA